MRIAIPLILIFFSFHCQGQQMANWSSYYENGFIWNPALTAKWNEIEMTATHRADWTGFDDAPQTSTLGIQVPFLKRVTRVSAGGYISRDAVGPFSKYDLAVTYNYRFAPQLFGNELDQLRLGMAVNASGYQYDPNRLNPYGDFNGDADILQAANNGFGFNVTMGAFYLNIDDFNSWKSHYYVGFSFNQLLPGSIGSNFLGKISTTPHATFHVGYRHLPYRRASHFFEPNLLVTYSFTKAINVMANLKYEKKNRYWLAGGLVNSGEVFFQAGFILTEDSFLGSIAGNGNYRIGIKGDYAVLRLRGDLGVGYEFYLAYFIDRD